MTDERHPDETVPTEAPEEAAPTPAAPETKHIEDDGEPLGANLA